MRIHNISAGQSTYRGHILDLIKGTKGRRGRLIYSARPTAVVHTNGILYVLGRFGVWNAYYISLSTFNFLMRGFTVHLFSCNRRAPAADICDFCVIIPERVRSLCWVNWKQITSDPYFWTCRLTSGRSSVAFISGFVLHVVRNITSSSLRLSSGYSNNVPNKMNGCGTPCCNSWTTSRARSTRPRDGTSTTATLP